MLIINKFYLKMPVHAPIVDFLANLLPKWGAVTSRPTKRTSLRRSTSCDVQIVRSVRPFLHSSPFTYPTKSYALQWAKHYPRTALLAGAFTPSSNTVHGSSSPPDSTSPMASRSVQLFLQGSRQSVPILYNGPPLSPKKLPLPMRDLDTHLSQNSLSPPESTTQTASRSLQPFLQGS